MERNTEKFRLRLNLFDALVLLLALGALAFLLWNAAKPEPPQEVVPEVTSAVRYTVRLRRWLPGTSQLVRPGDRITDSIKNYNIGTVVSVQAVPARSQVLDRESRRYVWRETEAYEDVLITLQAPCTVDEKAITVDGGYAVRVAADAYIRGEGYMGSGVVVSIEGVQG